MADGFTIALQGGDRRSIGHADAIAFTVLREPACCRELWECLADADPVVRMRAADALEKVSRTRPDLLFPYKKELLARSVDDGTAEVRWHLVVMISRMKLSLAETKATINHLTQLIEEDPSRLVKVMSLQAAVDLIDRHPKWNATAHQLLERAGSSSIPSLRARARKLAARHR